MLLICTAAIDDHDAIVPEIGSIDGVMSVLELLGGDRNVHVQAVGASKGDVLAVVVAIVEFGVAVNDATLVCSGSHYPPGSDGWTPADDS